VSNFEYYNRNPKYAILKDCVCRAISTATNLKYVAVDNLLELTAADYDCDKLCVCCYNHLLGDILCYRRIDCDYNRTVSDVARNYPNNKVIIRVEGHLTTSIFGTILDIWDCSDEYVDCYWIVE
jgi:hypothetical protein